MAGLKLSNFNRYSIIIRVFEYAVNNAAGNVSVPFNITTGFCSKYVNGGNDFAALTIDDETYEFSSNPSYTLMDSSNPTNGFVVSYAYNKSGELAYLNFNFMCNSSNSTTNSSVFNATYSDISPYPNVTINVSTEYGRVKFIEINFRLWY